jgi:hypothetical protein
MLKKYSILTLLLAGCLLTSGCPKKHVLPSAKDLNRGLNYLPWKNVRDAAPDNTIRVQPGMRLYFHYSPLRGKKQNIQVVGRSISSYDVKSDDFGTEDYEFLQWVLMTGHVSNTVPPDTNLRQKVDEAAKKLGEDDFNRKYVESIVKPTLGAMKLNYKTEAPYTFSGLASEIKTWLERPQYADFENAPLRGPALLVDLKMPESNPIRIHVFEFSSAYFNDEIGNVSKTLNNPSYASEVSNARGYVEVTIPVRLNGERKSLFYPVHLTVTELEKCYGLNVVGLRRHKRFFPKMPPDDATQEEKERFQQLLRRFPVKPPPNDATEDQKASFRQELLKRVEEHFIAKDDYFTVWFDDRQNTFGAKGFLYLDGTKEVSRSEVLLAPDDIIYLFERKRLTPTDSPQKRCGLP